MSQEPSIAAQTFRVGHIAASLRALERILNRQVLPDADLALLSQDLAQAIAATGPALSRAFAGERCLTIEDIRSSSQRFGGLGAATPAGFQGLVVELADFTGRISGVSDRRLLAYLDALDSFASRGRRVGMLDQDPRLDTQAAGAWHGSGIAQNPLQASEEFWEGILVRQTEMVARLRAARTALRIEQFRLGHQRLPTSLEEIPLEHSTDSPLDPFVPGSLVCKRLPQGFVVYSVGRDRHNNGGVEAPIITRGNLTNEYDLTFRIER
jgi:hypothetical protein